MTNIWIGVGRLTREPELRYAESNKAVAPMRIAVPRAGEGDSTDFFDVVAFGQLAEACATHLAKGRQVLVEGTLRHQSWTDAGTGDRRSRVEVLANRVQFLDAPRRDGTADATPDAACGELNSRRGTATPSPSNAFSAGRREAPAGARRRPRPPPGVPDAPWHARWRPASRARRGRHVRGGGARSPGRE